MRLEELLKAVSRAEIAGSSHGEITGLACDSRQVRAGYLFAALPGEKKDGRLFIPDAVQRGAVAVVTESEAQTPPGVCRIRVPDAKLAIAQMAAAFFGRPSDRLEIVGVTGTNGKTTTTYMIRDMLRANGRSPGLIGTVGYEIGGRAIPAGRTTPEAVVLQNLLAQMVNAGCRSAVMEVSSHSLVQKRTVGIDFDVGVFTNLTRDHLDYHKTLDNYFEAKSMLFSGLGKGAKRATAVVNVDDPWGQRLSARSDLNAVMVTYGTSTGAQVRATDLRLHSGGSAFAVESPWGRRRVEMRLMGRFNVSNALAALASGGALGVPLDLIADTLAHIRGVPGRLEEVETRRGFQVFVDYAHTDDALENVLTTLREITPRRLIVVFGCGGDRDKTKRPAMGRVAARLADYAILTSDNPRTEVPGEIIAQIRAGFGDAAGVESIEDREQAIRRALEMAAKGDIVIIAGKGHEAFQEFANTIVPFDDREMARKYLP